MKRISMRLTQLKQKYLNCLIISVILVILIYYFNLKSLQNYDKKIYKLDLNKFEAFLKSNCDCHSEEITLNYNDDLILVEFKNDTRKKHFSIKMEELEYSNLACSPYKVLRRGKNQKVISYSVFGNNPFYFRYLKLIVKTAKKLYPEWVIRFYHDKSFDQKTICELECLKDEVTNESVNNVDFCNIDELPYLNWKPNFLIPTFWRWLVVGDFFVDIFLSRDSDFCIVERDRDAVNDWLDSNSLFHVMRDHPYHDIFMLAGLWGFKMYKDRELAQKIFGMITDPSMSSWHKSYSNEKQADQIFLKKKLWSIVKKNVTIHASFNCHESDARPFPTQRPSYYCHVGGYGCCGPEYLNSSFPFECPYNCRPKEHKEWVFC